MDDLTVAQLQKLLSKKQEKLDALVKQRSDLAKRLSDVDRQITEVGGSPTEEKAPKATAKAKARKAGGKRPKNTKKLFDVIMDVLTENTRGLSLVDLSAKVVETGYKTNSANFPNTVYQCLYNNAKVFGYDSDARLYTLKAAKGPKGK